MSESRMIPVPGSERAPRTDATVTGAADAAELVQVTLVTAGINDAAVASIVGFAIDRHLKITAEHGLVKLTGTVQQMEDAFSVNLYQAKTENGSVFRSRVGPGEGPQPVRVPSELAPYVLAVLGLDSRPVATPHFRIHGASGNFIASNAVPQYTSTQVAQLYNFPPGDGSGRSVAVIELGGGFSPADCQAAGIDPSLVVAVAVDGTGNAYTGNPNSADGEVALDVQVIGGVVPKCRQFVYFAPNTDAGFVDAVAAALHQTPKPDAISISWGAPETSWTAQARNAMETIFAQCVAAGIPVFCASGDNGAKDGTAANVADFPASAPHATGCGGTQLTASSETVWNDAGGGATGGGLSQAFGTPAYQTSVGLHSRGVPDVSGDAAPSTGYRVIVNNRTYQFGGTSAVAPLWGALAALLVAATGKPIGDLNSKIYPLLGKGVMRDITAGNNGGYTAATGWDACTGCGSPDGTKLLAALGGNPPQPSPNPTPTPAVTLIKVIDRLLFSDGSVKEVQVWP